MKLNHQIIGTTMQRISTSYKSSGYMLEQYSMNSGGFLKFNYITNQMMTISRHALTNLKTRHIKFLTTVAAYTLHTKLKEPQTCRCFKGVTHYFTNIAVPVLLASLYNQ